MSLLTIAQYAEVQDIIKNLEGKACTAQETLILAGAKHAIENNAAFLIPITDNTSELLQMCSEAAILNRMH